MADNIPYDKIEEYLKGNLAGEELLAFEKYLASDENVKKEFDLYKEIRTAQKDNDLSVLENKLALAEKSYFSTKSDIKPKVKNASLTWIKGLAAAVFIGICFFIGSQYLESTSLDADKVYAEFAQHDYSFQEMSNDNIDLGTIQSLLKSAQYEKALPVIKSYLISHPETPEILLAKGITLLEMNQFDEAIEIFNDLSINFPLYLSEATWYKALTYTKQGNISESKSTLSKILENSSRYSDAQKMMGQLNKL